LHRPLQTRESDPFASVPPLSIQVQKSSLSGIQRLLTSFYALRPFPQFLSFPELLWPIACLIILSFLSSEKEQLYLAGVSAFFFFPFFFLHSSLFRYEPLFRWPIHYVLCLFFLDVKERFLLLLFSIGRIGFSFQSPSVASCCEGPVPRSI